MTRLVPALCVIAVVAACADGDTVRIIDTAGQVTLEVDIQRAATAEARLRGLRGHPPLSANEGLLLVWPDTVDACIVNSGVSFAIDVVYLSEDGSVVGVAANFAANDGQAVCVKGSRYVLEVAAGVASDIEVGHHSDNLLE